jgi:hypothetical protein
MTRIRIQKQKTRRRPVQGALEALGTTTDGASELLESVEELLDEIDRTLRSAS